MPSARNSGSRSHRAGGPKPATGLLGKAVRALAAAGLAVDAWVHAHLAEQYDSVAASVSQGNLFRAEAGLASLAALLVLVWHRLPSAVLAWLVAAGGLALLLVYRYVDVGSFGPVPDMYEPAWGRDKLISAIAQAVALLMATCLLFARRRRRAPRVE